MNVFARFFNVVLAIAFLFLSFLSAYMLAVFFENGNAGGNVEKGAAFFGLSAFFFNAGCFIAGNSGANFKVWLHKLMVIASIAATLFSLTASVYSFIVWIQLRDSASLKPGMLPLIISGLTFIIFFWMVHTIKDLLEDHQDLKVIKNIHQQIAA